MAQYEKTNPFNEASINIIIEFGALLLIINARNRLHACLGGFYQCFKIWFSE